MDIMDIHADMAEKAATIDPLGKTLKFCLDDEIMTELDEYCFNERYPI